jgi:hypothetical protein
MKILDALVRDQKVAPDWVEALRRVDPTIDGKVDVCLTKLSDSGPYLPTEGAIRRAFEIPSVRSIRLARWSTGPDVV